MLTMKLVQPTLLRGPFGWVIEVVSSSSCKGRLQRSHNDKRRTYLLEH
uniref:Uncharacterized protein n=1 Tax=Rhizophora mucronata TaxID=61149 RepID=A0A2P2JGN6_RHIMU